MTEAEQLAKLEAAADSRSQACSRRAGNQGAFSACSRFRNSAEASASTEHGVISGTLGICEGVSRQ